MPEATALRWLALRRRRKSDDGLGLWRLFLFGLFATFVGYNNYSLHRSLILLVASKETAQLQRSMLEGPRLCNDIPFDPTDLQQAINAAEVFHKFGGNLKSVQRFRDAAVDQTLERLSLKFVSERAGVPQEGQALQAHLQEYYNKNWDSRGGYGKPLPGRFVRKEGNRPKTSKPELFENRWVEPLEETTGRGKWDAALGPTGPTCPKLIQLGDKDRGDGFKFICQSDSVHLPEQQQQQPSSVVASAPLEPRLGAALRKLESIVTSPPTDCHILSVGGNDNWILEEAVVSTLKDCVTHTFDCTLPNNAPQNKPDNPNVRFYPHCLDGHSYQDPHGRSFVTYRDMLTMAGIEGAPTYLKIDVEGFEYDIFTDMIRGGGGSKADANGGDSSTLSLLPQQIQVELHWATRMTGVEWMLRTRGAGELALFSSMMYLGGGYLPIHLDFNPGCVSCMEVLYYKTVC